MLKILSEKEYLLRVKDGDGDMNKNTTNKVVTSLELQTGILLKAFK